MIMQTFCPCLEQLVELRILSAEFHKFGCKILRKLSGMLLDLPSAPWDTYCTCQGYK
jgi:hypothetical protein